MTDKPTPTDAELKAMWQLHAADIGGIFCYARAVLAKWGQPAQAAEPFCWHWENTFNGGTGTVKKNPETLGTNMSHPDYKWTALYTAPQPTPQPTQAQAGAVTDAQVLAAVRVVSPGLFRHGLQPLPNDGANTAAQMRKEADTARKMLDAAFSAAQPVAREPLPKFLALKFHARRDKKATVTLLFPGHEAADAWVRGIRGGQHGTDT